MSASKTTTNYNLPVFEPNDVPAWLTDWNGAMGDIDTAIAGAKTAADTAQLTASGAANGVSTLNTTVGNLQTTVGNLGSTVTSLGNSLNTVQSLIGNGTPTTTDQTIIGAINEINAAYKDAENIKFDNTGTGMSATNVQAAIVEAYGHGGGGGGSTAAAVSYDNTSSGLTATNVQAAIDELAAAAQTSETVRYAGGYIQYYDGSQWVNWVAPAGTSLTEIIPALTSNTSAQSTVGVVTATAAQTMNSNDAYYAFDSAQPATPLVKMNGNTITFTLNEATLVNVLRGYIHSSNGSEVTANLEVTTDGNTWTSVKTQRTTSTGSTWDLLNIEINTVITGFRITGGSGGALLNVYGLNAYLKSV